MKRRPISLRRRWRTIMGHLRTLRECSRGASAVEFAIIVPALGVLLTGTIDLAQLGNQGLILDAAIRAGAAYAMGCNPQNYDCATGIQNVITGYATSLGSSVSVSFPNATTGTAWYPESCSCDDGTTITCNNDTSSGGALCASGPKHFYIKMHAVWTLPEPMMPLGILPGSLSRTLTVRVL